MNKIIRKVFWVWNLEKEEAWLNEMASNGWVLVSVKPFKYEFATCTPDTRYGIKVLYLDKSITGGNVKSYITFLCESGVEYISLRGNFVYLRKKITNGPFEIFSDNISKIKYLKGLKKEHKALVTLYTVLLLLYILQLIIFMNSFTINFISIFYLILSILMVLLITPCIAKIQKLNREIKQLEKETMISG